MGVSQEEFRLAKGRYLSLGVIANDDRAGEVAAVTVEMEGIRGGHGRGARQVIAYRLFVDVSMIDHSMPGVWVLDPSDGSIKHANIFHPRPCPLLGRPLPEFCWGGFPQPVGRAESSQRTLTAFLADVAQFLGQQNFKSPAR